MNPLEIPIVVVSWDANDDLWKPFFELFFTNWPGCHHPLHLVTNHREYADSRITSVKIGDPVDFSTDLSEALTHIDAERIILWNDDRPPIRPVKEAELNRWMQEAIDLDVAYLKLLVASPFGQANIGRYIAAQSAGTKFRASLTVGLWKTGILRGLLRPGENPWQCEVQVGKRSREVDAVFASPIYKPPFLRKPSPLVDVHIMRRGCISRSAHRTLQNKGLGGALRSDRRFCPPWTDWMVKLWDVWVESVELFRPRSARSSDQD